MSSSEYEELTFDECEWEEEGEGEEEQQPEIYYSEDFISGPHLSKKSTLPGNILEFDYSFGYDCKRHFNMTVADENTIIFASGNLINFFNVESREFRFRRSAFGGGIGHIAKNPNPEYSHIAIAENGFRPPIIIYDWPSLEIICLLKEGTAKSFSHLCYSPDGMLLASQGGEPDFLITIFNWVKHRVILRTKSNVNEVYRVMFSPDVPGQLTTCGLTHIKFWKMVQTFTGLKLQGDLGRFGKTEFCDILGVYPMPDEKVLSGCAWGNILVWDEGLITLEVCRKLRKRCHDAAITQFFYSNGDLWTVGMDGRVRVWFYDTIDQADPPDDDRFVQVEPIYDFYTPNVIFMCIYKQNDDPKNTFYYAQDGNGGLWRIDLDIDNDPQPAEQLYKCHAGAVVDIAACPWGPFLASLGIDGRLQIYQYEEQKLLFTHDYMAKGACMIWLPLSVQPSGDEIIMGFDDGNVRVAIVEINTTADPVEVLLTTIQVLKPHSKPVTKMTINNTGSILVTGGEDATIFIFQILTSEDDFATLIPIGYIKVPGIVTYLTWHHMFKTVVLVGCIQGHFVEVDVPTKPVPYTTITYILYLKPNIKKFVSYKSQIRRDIKIREIEARKAKKVAKKLIELEKLKKENPGLDIDKEVFLADSDSEEVFEPLYKPEIPNKILWLRTTEENTIWLSMSGYDAGYIYEYYMDQESEIPAFFQMVYNGDDIEISSYLYSKNQKYLILAMQDGSIRVVKTKEDNWRDWSDYWQLSMHDNYNGFIPKMCFNKDETYFFTCGHDGNIFSYKFFPEERDVFEYVEQPVKLSKNPINVEDDYDGYTRMSLEEAIVQAEIDRVLRVANERKRILREKLATLRSRFESVLERNEKLPPTQIIPREQLEVDHRVTKNLEDKLNDDLALVKRKLAFQVAQSRIAMEKLRKHFTSVVDYFPIAVYAIQKNQNVLTTRQRDLTRKFKYMIDIVEQKIIEEELKHRPPERAVVVIETPPPPEKKEKQLEYFLVGLSPSTLEFRLPAKLKRLLNKYRARKLRIDKRQDEWDAFNATKPVENLNDPEDEAALAQAIETIGDFKLKTSLDYKVPRQLRETTVKKYKQLLNARLEQYAIRNTFNKRVYSLRQEKVKLRDYLERLQSEIEKIHEEIPEDLRRFGPAIPEFTDSDFYEKNLEVDVQVPKDVATKKEVKAKTAVQSPTGDLLEKEILLLTPEDEPQDPEKVEEDFIVQCVDTDTPWETEIRTYRQERKLFDQTYIINKMQSSIEKFDAKLTKLAEDRLQVAVDATFIDIHILTLHQELIILKDFESVEDKLQDKVHVKMNEILDMQDVLREIGNKIDIHIRKIAELEDLEKEIQQQFFLAVTDNKFYDFLRRIFKKKYKPPKVRGPDDDSSSDESSSSSEESEESDAGSIDSRDFGIIRLDENVCPKGCDLGLYNMTFDLRNKRHGVELEVKDQRAIIENFRKDLDLCNKKLRLLENNLKICETDLETYQREKQRKLNEIMCTVVLKIHQLQHLLSVNESNNVKNVLVFSQDTLSKLYKRVGELYKETVQQKAKHKSNITHLCRMKTDCKHMEGSIEKLKKDIVEKMILRFNREIDIDELEEVQLKRMILDLRLSLLDIRELYEKEIALWKKKYGEKQVELAQVIKDNTARMELLALMSSEKTDLAKIIALQDKKREHLDNVTDISEVLREDLEKLALIKKEQEKEMKLLRAEIKRLKIKAPPPPKIPTEPEEEQEEEEDIWDYDKYLQSITLEKPEEELELAATDMDVSSIMHEELEMMARSLILEMLESFDHFHCMSKASLQIFIGDVLESVLKRRSVMEIVDNLIAFLPTEPSDAQQEAIETVAELLFAIIEQATKVDENIEEITEKILERVPPSTGATYDYVAKMITDIVKQIPIEILKKDFNLNYIVQKMKDRLPKREINKEELVKEILQRMEAESEEINQVLNEILEKMFGIGLDYLYYIKL